MLNSEDIHFVFDTAMLQEGDILLMNTYHERQRKRMVGCIYDHAAIYAGDAFIMEADGLGVVQSHVYSYGFKEKGHACVLRLKDTSMRKQKAIVEKAREEMGKAYGIREAYAVLEFKDNAEQKPQANTTFCSRLVASAYMSQGYRIATNPNYCAPDDFLKSDLLFSVDDAVVPATEDVIPTILKQQSERENPEIELQEAFERYSKLYGCSIQSIGDLLLAAVRHPELDEEGVRVLNEDLRLFHPEEETRNSWPWFDDDTQFKEHFRSVEDRLFFLHNQFLHYDKTYLPLFAKNGITLAMLCVYYPHCKMMARYKDGFTAVYEEAVRVRKRLADLYVDTFYEEREEFSKFIHEYGPYVNFEYHEVVTDLSFMLEAIMKYGFPHTDAGVSLRKEEE